MERGPDLSRLREAAAEFELRQVIQRLEDEWEGDVPDRPADERDRGRGGRGRRSADLGDGEISFAIALPRGRWGGYDGERLIAGELPGPADARGGAVGPSARRPRRQVDRRALAARAARPTSPPGRSTSPTTR